MTEVENRYARQELISGWDQSKLDNSNIGIVGSGHIATYTAASLAALGVGKISIYDDTSVDYLRLGKMPYEREFLLTNAPEESSKVENLEKIVKKINPLVNIYGIHMTLDDITEDLVEKPDLMIISSNEFEKTRSYVKYCLKNKINFYAAVGDKKGAILRRYSNKMSFPDYTDYDQDPITSEIIGGLLAGEVLQEIMHGKGVKMISYTPSDSRFNCNFMRDYKEGDLTKKKVLMIGAGALGNFFGIGVAQTNIGELYVVDDDTIEATNLNRQILFYDSIGQKKAEVLSKRLKEVNPEMRIKPLVERVNESFGSRLEKIKPDLIVDCVDNLSTRAILNYFALKYNIPLISGGTDYSAGQVIVFEPGKSRCLDCKLNVNKAYHEARRARSCIHAPTASVVITNHIIGGLMAAESRCVLDSKNYGISVQKTIKYDSEQPMRVGLIGASAPCHCTPSLLDEKKDEKPKTEELAVFA